MKSFGQCTFAILFIEPIFVRSNTAGKNGSTEEAISRADVKLDRWRAPQRLTDYYYSVRRNASGVSQIIPRRASIQIQTSLGRCAFALTVATVVDDENFDRQLHHFADHFVAVSYIACVAVKPKHYHI